MKIAILTISDTRDRLTDRSGGVIARLSAEAGHDVCARQIVPDDVAAIRAAYQQLLGDFAGFDRPQEMFRAQTLVDSQQIVGTKAATELHLTSTGPATPKPDATELIQSPPASTEPHLASTAAKHSATELYLASTEPPTPQCNATEPIQSHQASTELHLASTEPPTPQHDALKFQPAATAAKHSATESELASTEPVHPHQASTKSQPASTTPHPASTEPDILITTGGTGIARRDVTLEALAPFVATELPGFGETFRALSYADIGSHAIASRATAFFDPRDRLVFALPGSTAACTLAMTSLILPEMEHLIYERRK